MRILAIRLKNLNSLAGEWSIDFTRPEFTDSGIFVITGPTGAGKTTILDSLALALFGRTPRIDKVTASANETMSRLAGECFAEVVFRSAGRQYRCHWSQRRARGSADGKLQAPKHILDDITSGKIIEEKLSLVPKKVEEITGLDYSRFTRSVLLAQGDFAAFLQASPEDKAPIMERITGTQIYSRISEVVHQQTRIRNDNLKSLQEDCQRHNVLPPDEETEQRSLLKQLEEKTKKLRAERSKAQDMKNWLAEKEKLEKELADLAQQLASAEEERKQALPSLEKLKAARLAARVMPLHSAASGLRKRTKDINDQQESIRAAIPMAEIKAQEAAASLNQLKLAEAGLLEAESKEREILKQTRSMDEKISGFREQIAKIEKAKATKASEFEQSQQTLNKNRQDIEALDSELTLIAGYFESNVRDEGLLAELSAIRGKLANWQSHTGKLNNKKLSVDALKKEAALLRQTEESIRIDSSSNKQEIAEYEKAEKALLAEIFQVTAGLEEEQLRQNAAKVSNRLQGLEKLSDFLARLAEQKNEVARYSEEAKNFTSRRDELGPLIKEQETARTSVAEKIALLERQQELELKVLSLEEERKRLTEGEPCPLCGSKEHPYAAGNFPTDAKSELEKARRQLDGIDAKILEFKTEHHRADDSARASKERRETAQKAIEKLQQELEALSKSLELEPKNIEQAHSLLLEAQQENSKLAEALKRLDASNARLKKTIESIRQLKEQASEQTAKLEACLAKKQAKESELSSLETELEEESKLLLQSEEELRQIFLAYGLEPAGKGFDSVFAKLEAKHNHWKEKKAEETSLKEKRDKLAAKLAVLSESLSRMKEEMAEADKESSALMQEKQGLEATRRELYGDRDPEEGERAWRKKLEDMRQSVESASTNKQQLAHGVDSLRNALKEKEAERSRVSEELALAEEKLTDALSQAGLADERELLNLALPHQEIAELEDKEKLLTENEARLGGLQQDKKSRMEELQKLNLTDKSMEEVASMLASADTELDKAAQDLGGINQRLADNDKAKLELSGLLQRVEAQKRECKRWEELDELIGSADGKKFRSFAQGITFDVLISLANQRLAKLSGRYTLTSEPEKPLEFSVIDAYQGSEVRSAKNLSGGESFIVSLALALGLANMAGENAPIDSFFLDEGFGTLDEEALETVLGALSMLRQEGKLIGVVSHVAELNERIPVRISVSPSPSGFSSLSGNGCTRG